MTHPTAAVSPSQAAELSALTELAQHLQRAREDERQRLARDLHDELGSLLTSAKLDAARIRSRLTAVVPEQPPVSAALERLTHLVGTLDQVIALTRSIVEELRPSALAHLGLVTTLEILASEFAAQSGLAVRCALTPVRLSASAELVVYRVVQESINNIGKHAQASDIEIRLGAAHGRVEVQVGDDGCGFDPAARASATPGRRGHGLVGMRYRVEAEGGTLRVESAPGHGTRIHLSLPEAEATGR